MKKFLMGSAALLVLTACGGGDGPAASPEEVNAALTQLSLRDSGSGRVEFEERADRGNEVTFRNVMIRTSDFDDGEDDAETGMVESDGVAIELEGEGDLKIEEMTFTGLSVDDAGAANFSSLVMSALEIVPTDPAEAENASFTIGEVELENPSPALAAWLAGVFGHAEEVGAPDAANTSFDALNISNILMEGDDEGSGHIRMNIASINAEDYGPEMIGSLSVNGIDFSFEEPGESGTFSLGKLSIGGVSGALLQALAASDDDNEADLMSVLYANPMDPGFNEFSMEDLSLNAVGLMVSLDDLSYDISRNSDGVPTRFEFPEFTLTIDADAEGGEAGAQFAPVLAMIGMERLVISGEGTSTYDPETDVSTTESSSFSIRDAFTFSSTSEIGGISQMASAMEGMDPDAFLTGEQDPQAMMMEVYSMLDVHEFSFTLKDEGLLDKVFAILGPQQGMTAEDMRSMAVGMTAMLPGMAGGFGVDPAIATDLSQALNAFLSGTEDELTLTFNPATPFTLTDLMSDPTQLTQERLGFSAEAN